MSVGRATTLVVLAAAIASATSLVAACNDDDTTNMTDAGASDVGQQDDLPLPPRGDGATGGEASTCGESACSPASYKGVLSLSACCTAEATCGLDLLPLGALRTVPKACAAFPGPGKPSVDCIGLSTDRDGSKADVHEGCCRPNNTCGIVVKPSDDLDLGCQAPEDFIEGFDGGPPAPCDLDAGADAGGD